MERESFVARRQEEPLTGWNGAKENLAVVDVDADDLALSRTEDCGAGLVGKLLAGSARSALGVERDARNRTTLAGNVKDDGKGLAAGAPSNTRRSNPRRCRNA